MLDDLFPLLSSQFPREDVRIKGGPACQSQNLSGLRVEGHNGASLVSQQLLRQLLETKVDGEIQVIPSPRLLHRNRPLLVSQRVCFNQLLPCAPSQETVIGILNPILAHDAALMEIRIVNLFQLIR